MKLINIGCGYPRPASPWINLDSLHSVLQVGTPERANLDAEPNYVDHDLRTRMPFGQNEFNGALCSHVLEHFDCVDAARICQDARRILKPGSPLVVSVPDADFFLKVYDKDTPENAESLFGHPIGDPQFKRYFDWALWFFEHRQILTESYLRCILLRAGFDSISRLSEYPSGEVMAEIRRVMNRPKFSLELVAVKS